MYVKNESSTINNVTKYVTYVTCEEFVENNLEKAIKKAPEIESYDSLSFYRSGWIFR